MRNSLIICKNLGGVKSDAPLTLVTIRGIFVATILDMAPEIFEQKAADGSTFRCSDSFLRKWLHETMGWSERRSTRAGHKLPDDCLKVMLRVEQPLFQSQAPSSSWKYANDHPPRPPHSEHNPFSGSSNSSYDSSQVLWLGLRRRRHAPRTKTQQQHVIL